MSNKYTYKNIIIITIVMTITYVYSLIYAPAIEGSNDNSFTTKIAELHKSCLLNCETTKCKEFIENDRGDKYFISIPQSEQEDIKSCIITFWGVTHFIMYFILGYFVPAFYIELIFVGIFFEIYEYYKYQCHDIKDIYLNTIGILLGRYISPFN